MSEQAYGIDLGTTYSAIAHVNDLGIAEVVNNFSGKATTPSVVYFESPTNAIVGEEAKNSAVMEPDDTSMLIKRHMGTEFPQNFHDQEYTPEAISAMILRSMVEHTNEVLGQDVNKVVITVPAYFGAQERQATSQAGEIAGLDVLSIITEPVAAALSIGASTDADETIMVYDLGGGTFDTTIMRLGSGEVEVLAIDGNRELGGADWDEALMEIVLEKYAEEAGVDADELRDDEDFMVDLRLKVEELKKNLSGREEAAIQGLNFNGTKARPKVTREEFETATKHLVAQTIETSKRCVATAEEKVSDIKVDRVLLVGGSSRMPMIENALNDELGWDPQPTDFDLAVAKGAAQYAQDIVDGKVARATTSADSEGGNDVPLLPGGVTITNVLSRSVGIKLVRDASDNEGYINFFAHSNDKIPMQPDAIKAGTVIDNQSYLEVGIYEQSGDVESENVNDNRLLKKAEMEIPVRKLPKGSPINLKFEINSEGLVTVDVTEPESGNSLRLEAAVSILDESQVAAETEKVSAMTLQS